MHHIDPVYTVADHEVQHLHRHYRNQAALSPAHVHAFINMNLSCIDTAWFICLPSTEITVPVTSWYYWNTCTSKHIGRGLISRSKEGCALGLTSFSVDAGVQVIGCITASWMPVLMRSNCGVLALLGLLGCLPGLLGFLPAKLAFLELACGKLARSGTGACGELAGTGSAAWLPKNGSTCICSRPSEPRAAYPAYAVSCVSARNSAMGRASLPKCSA